MTKTQKVTVLNLFTRTVTRFNPTEKVDTMAKESSTRLQKFQAHLFGHFFPKTDEELQFEAEEKQKLEEHRKQLAAKRSHLPRTAKSNALNATTEISASPKVSSGKLSGKRRRSSIGEDGKVLKLARRNNISLLPCFDDSMPLQYPVQFGSRPPKWMGHKECVQLLDIPPHRMWNKDLLILNAESWLHGMGVPIKHRAHLFLSSDDLERNHHAVFHHAAIRAAFTTAIQNNELFDMTRKRTEDAKTRALRIAEHYPEISQGCLSFCREKVMNKGFCVVEGIFDDRVLPDGPVKTIYGQKPASKVVEYYLKQFPTLEDIKQSGKNEFWEASFNGMENAGEGRFATTREGLLTHVEEKDSTVEVARCRAALEVRALQLCVAMRFEETGRGMLAIPCTVCRLFTSTSNCERQVANTDFDTEADTREIFLPKHAVDYSVMWIADDAIPVVIWEYSHILQSGTEAATKNICQTAEAQRIFILPFSCLFMCGDIFYAAAGCKDWTPEEKNTLKHSLPVRFHMYVCRWGIERIDRHKRLTDAPVVPETVNFSSKFQPATQEHATGMPYVYPMRD